MDSRMEVFGLSAVVTLMIQLIGFSFAYMLQTETFYDILGGLNYLVLAGGTAYRLSSSSSSLSSRQAVTTALFVVSRSWLLLFLAWRAHERKGDSRFDGVKNRFGMFLVFWLVQGFWVFLISMPMIYVNSSSSSSEEAVVMSVKDTVCSIGMALGILIEIVSDIQKTAWIKFTNRKGGFCSTGIWNYSRHPNYFGEMLQWWCAWFLAYDGDDLVLWFFCVLSPLFTMHILLNVDKTGVAQAEGKGLKRYYTHADPAVVQSFTEYRQNTSILIPIVGYKYIPMSIKRLFLFEWERYEYRPSSDSSSNCNGGSSNNNNQKND